LPAETTGPIKACRSKDQERGKSSSCGSFSHREAREKEIRPALKEKARQEEKEE
jgi:hypothetical protein